MRTNTPAPLRIVIVERDDTVRALWKFALQLDPAVTVVDDTGDGDEGVDLIGRHHPDVVLMDVDTTCLDGLSAPFVVRHEHPAVGIVTVSESLFLTRAIQWEAVGEVCLGRATVPADLATILRGAWATRRRSLGLRDH
jgi:chemotaxis response regulator CheB